MLRLLGVLVWATAAHGADWPQWRGPNRDGISAETGLLASWPADGPPLAWKATGIGTGYSSVAVVGGKIVTVGDLEDGAYVQALDGNGGKPLWKARLGDVGGGAGFPGPRSTPTVDGSKVYALGQHGDLVCLQVADGKEVWRKSLTRDFGGKMMSAWGYSESVLVDGDKLLCAPGGAAGTVVALNKNTGVLVWRSQDLTDTAAYSSLVPADILGAQQIVVFTAGHVAGIASDTGKVLWSAPRKGKTAVVPTPVVRDNLVFVTSGYGIGCNLFKVSRTGAQFSVEEVYANTAMVNLHGGVVLVKDHIYGYSDNGGWSCLNFKTGEVAWVEKKLGKGTLLYADGHLYLREEKGKSGLVLIEATPTGWKETGRFTQPDRSDKNAWPHLVVSGGKLFVRDHDVLLCFDIKKK